RWKVGFMRAFIAIHDGTKHTNQKSFGAFCPNINGKNFTSHCPGRHGTRRSAIRSRDVFLRAANERGLRPISAWPLNGDHSARNTLALVFGRFAIKLIAGPIESGSHRAGTAGGGSADGRSYWHSIKRRGLGLGGSTLPFHR